MKFIYLIFALLYLCGDIACQRSSPNTKIVGGDVVGAREYFSYQASLRYRSQHFCGGIIYDRRHILTAAHCLVDVNDKFLTVVVGDLNVHKPDKNTIEADVDKITVHEKYNAETFVNDIAIIALEEDLIFNDYIKPIDLINTTQYLDERTVCTISGWGSVSEGGAVSSELRFAKVNIIPTTTCKEAYGENGIHSGMICAGSPDKDSCQGDSGGPMVCDNQLVGIVSWGRGCARRKYPGVYTDVSYFQDWIKENSANTQTTSLLLSLTALTIILLKN